jgi:hypothetical protein
VRLLDFGAGRAFAISGFGSRSASSSPLTLSDGDAHVVESERLIPHVP